MSYAIIRNANYKKENLAGLYKHNERKNTNYSNKEIDKTKSINNYSIKSCNTTYSNAIKILQKENNLHGRIIKTTNVVCEFIITSDKDFFEEIGTEETKRYFQTAYNFVKDYKNLGEKYILSSKVHMDETTPHMHLTFIPVVHAKNKEGNKIDKIACSEYWKGKDSYRRLQDSFYKYITDNGFNLERGKSINEKHINIETLKQITEYENIKYEMNQEEIKPIVDTLNKIDTKDTNKMSLIVEQNKELIKYTNKLKLQLVKSYTAIKKSEELQRENMNLKYQNQELKKENSRLENYIQKTFEVVKHLFDFPIERFKSLIDNFIRNNNLEK